VTGNVADHDVVAGRKIDLQVRRRSRGDVFDFVHGRQILRVLVDFGR
jgi:hypothetical protein